MQMSLMCLLCETSCGLHLLPYGPSVLITHYSESHRHNVFEIDPNGTHRWIEIKKKKKKEKKCLRIPLNFYGHRSRCLDFLVDLKFCT